jgi:hypothetical protein
VLDLTSLFFVYNNLNQELFDATSSQNDANPEKLSIRILKSLFASTLDTEEPAPREMLTLFCVNI